MTVMTGGEGLVAGLIEHGIDTVFGLPGVQTYGLFDALHRAQPKIRIVGARHEQTCGYMAFGYARSTGRPATFSVVPGPGMLNAAAAMLTAQSCNEPVLLLTGQVPMRFLDRGRGHLHEMRDQLATMRSIVKWAERAESPSLSQVTVARIPGDALRTARRRGDRDAVGHLHRPRRDRGSCAARPPPAAGRH